METGVPLSTCYEVIRKLLKAHMLKVDRIRFGPSSKKIVFYRSTLRGISADLGHGHFALSVVPNDDL